jgi:hypothetical protein
MMEWLGGTLSKEDIGEDNPAGRQRRKRDEEGDDDALGALALRFKQVTTPLGSCLCIDRAGQAFGILPESASTNANIFFEGLKANTSCSCIIITWTVKTPFRRLCRYTR